MGSFCKPSPQVQTQNTNTNTATNANTVQQQSYAPNAAVLGAGTEAIDMARAAANQPFQMPAAPVAGFNPFQTQSFNQIQGMQGSINPYFANARIQADRAGAPVNEADINQYMNPYAGATLDNMKKYIFDPQRVSGIGRDTSMAGGVGADRIALTSQNLDKTQGDAIGSAMAGFYQPAMNMAQAQKQQALQTAQGWANLGMTNLSGRLQETGALMGAGNQQQAQTQAELMSPYQQELARIAYPYQNAQFLAGITGGLAPSMGGTTSGYSNTSGNTTGNTYGTTTTTPAQASPLNQILGLGMAGAGMYMGIPGFGSFFGGGGGGSGNTNPFMPSGLPNYTAYPYAGQNRGGAVKRAAGGAVNPWDFARGFDDGGGVDVVSPYEFNSIDEAAPDYSRPIERPAPSLGMWPFNRGMADYKGDVTMYPDSPAQAAPAAPTVAPARAPAPNPWEVPANAGTRPMPDAYRTPLPSAIPPPEPKRPSIVAAGSSPASGDGPGDVGGSRRSGSGISEYLMPKSQAPYPDALDRDWGQKLTRSPWMSLVTAGLRTAQSIKGGASGLAEGLEAGVGHLDKQRGELRSEQQINQKAEALYQHAREELNKYTKMTPYQQASLDRERYQWSPGMGIDPVSGQTVPGAYRMPTRSDERPEFIPNMTLTGKNALGGSTALQKNVEFLVSSGIAPDKTSAFNMIHQSVNSPAIYQRLVQAQEKILQADHQWMRKSSDERRAEAERIIRSSQREVQSLNANPTASAAPPAAVTGKGTTSDTALPDPGDGKRVPGLWYINPRTGKPDQWR